MPDPTDGSNELFHCYKTLVGHTRAVSSVKFSQYGEKLASASADKTVCVWSPDTKSPVLTLAGHSFGVNDVSWHPSDSYLCSASDDNTLRLWDIEKRMSIRTMEGHTNFVFCCSFNTPGNVLASGSFDETLRLWDVRSGRCIREVPAHSDPLTSVSFSGDGRWITTSSLDGLVRVWDVRTGLCLRTLYNRNSSAPVTFARFSSNAKYILCNSLDSRIRLWNIESGQVVRVLAGHHVNANYCLASAFYVEADTTWGVTGSEDGSVCLYDLNRKGCVQKISAAGETPLAKGGKQPAATAAAGQGGIKMEVEEGSDSAPASENPSGGHCDAVLCVDVNSDEKILATGGHERDRTIKIWGRPTGSNGNSNSAGLLAS